MPTKGFTTPGTRRVSFYDPELSTGYSTSSLWRTCPLLEYFFDPSIGVLLDETFQSYNAAATTGDYVLTQATAGSAAISTTAPGTLSIDSGSTTTAQGANVQRAKSAFIPAAGKHIWAEFNVSYTGVGALNVETAVGLFEIDTSVIAAAAVSTANGIGWTSVTDDGILLFDTEKASASATRAATTIVSATKVRLGFYVDGVTAITQYINGVATGTDTATANIPIVALYPTFVCHSGGTDQPVLHVHGYRIFQLR
jgi:hypothetical protein